MELNPTSPSLPLGAALRFGGGSVERDHSLITATWMGTTQLVVRHLEAGVETKHKQGRDPTRSNLSLVGPGITRQQGHGGRNSAKQF